MSKIIEAAQFAHKAHIAQKRKYSNEPYIVHPMRVAGMVSMHPSANEDLVCAAWLHDVIEDCDITAEILSDMFGANVALLVEELTNKSKGMNAPRAERKRIDREALSKASFAAKLIKLFDRRDNLMDLIRHPPQSDFCQLYARESRELLRYLGDVDDRLVQDIIELAGRLG